MSNIQKRFHFLATRFLNFIKLFLRNKRGLVGFSMILFFAFLALFAPYLTPYNQLGEVPTKPNTPLSSSTAAPSWLRTFPPALGGNPTLSENIQVVDDPTFSSSNWRWPNGEWNVSVSPDVGSAVEVRYDPEGGYPLGNETGDGCVIISFKRSSSQTYGNITIRLYKEFDYPYSGPPGTGQAQGTILINGTIHRDYMKVWSIKKSDWEYIESDAYDVNGTLCFFAEKVGGAFSKLWPTATYKSGVFINETGFFAIASDWSLASPLIEARTIFYDVGLYRFGVELFLSDTYNGTENAVMEVRVDNLKLDLLGTGWGTLGTDYFGRDILAELIYGARVSLYVGLISSALAVIIGLVVGLAAGYLGAFPDELMMRVTDILLVLPGLPLLIVLFAVFGASIENLIILNGFLGWMGFSKLVRSQVLSLRSRAFIEAAKASGAGGRYIMVRHVLPNVMSLVYVTLATTVPAAIVSEAALSWLGFADPRRMSWGRMLFEMQQHNATTKLWWVLPPGLAIAGISVSFILLGFALDEVLNPKLRLRR